MRYAATVLIAVSLALAATNSLAQRSRRAPAGTTGQGMSQGTAEERAACGPSVRRFCRGAGNDSVRVLSCLQEHRAQISRACRNVLERNGQ